MRKNLFARVVRSTSAWIGFARTSTVQDMQTSEPSEPSSNVITSTSSSKSQTTATFARAQAPTEARFVRSRTPLLAASGSSSLGMSDDDVLLARPLNLSGEIEFTVDMDSMAADFMAMFGINKEPIMIEEKMHDESRAFDAASLMHREQDSSVTEENAWFDSSPIVSGDHPHRVFNGHEYEEPSIWNEMILNGDGHPELEVTDTTNDKHEFEVFDGASGMVCTAMVMRDGGGDQCGRGRLHPVHAVIPSDWKQPWPSGRQVQRAKRHNKAQLMARIEYWGLESLVTDKTTKAEIVAIIESLTSERP